MFTRYEHFVTKCQIFGYDHICSYVFARSVIICVWTPFTRYERFIHMRNMNTDVFKCVQMRVQIKEINSGINDGNCDSKTKHQQGHWRCGFHWLMHIGSLQKHHWIKMRPDDFLFFRCTLARLHVTVFRKIRIECYAKIRVFGFAFFPRIILNGVWTFLN